MPSQKIPQKQRVSKSEGRIMILVGVFFDLLPIFMFLGAIFFVMYSIGGVFGNLVESADKVGSACSDAGGWWNVMGKGKCLVSKAGLAIKATAVLASGVGTGIFLGPGVYLVGSFFASTTAYIVFTLWFLLKGVNMWSFNKIERVLVNVTAIVVENIPLLDLLPGITLMVWRHVKIAQIEDGVENSERLQKALRLTKAQGAG